MSTYPFLGGFKQSLKQIAEPRVTTEYPKEKRQPLVRRDFTEQF